MPKLMPRLTPWLLFVFGTLAMSFDLTVPSFWQDEAATISGSARPISQLLQMATKIDVVHSFYYGLMHFWSGIFGYSVFMVRLPSILAVGLTCALIYLLVRKLNGSYSLAVWGSLLFLAIPRTHFASGENRSNALTATLAVALTLALIIVLQSKHRPILVWLGYAILAALSTYVFMFSFLLAIPHGIYVLAKHRSKIFYFLGAWVLAILGTSPLFYWGYHEKNQVSWIKLKPLSSYLYEAAISVNFLSRPWLAAAFIALSALAVLIYLRARTLKISNEIGDLTQLAAMWAVLPSAGLIAASFAIHPYFVDHYLTFTTPATAILGSIGLHQLRIRFAPLLAGLVILVLGFFSLQDSRSPWSHGPIWMPVVKTVASNTAPGDGLLLPDWRTRNSAETQIMMDAYRMEYFPGRVELTLIVPPSKSKQLFGIHSKEKDAPRPQVLMNKISLITDSVDPIPALDQVPLWVSENYKITKSVHFKDANVTIFSKK